MVQSPTVSDLMRDCSTSACSPPENVPCTSPNCGRPSSLAKSVSSATSEPPVSMKKVTSSPPLTRTLTTGSGSVFKNFRRVVCPSPCTS